MPASSPRRSSRPRAENKWALALRAMPTPPRAPRRALGAPRRAPRSDVYLVERVLERRVEDDGAVRYRVRWLGYGPASDTWEPMEFMVSTEARTEALALDAAHDAAVREQARAAAAAREAAEAAAQDARDLAVLRHLALGEALVGSVRETLLANMHAACSPMANRLSRYMFREGDVTRRCDALTAMPVEIMDALHGDGRRKTTKYTDTVTHLCTASLLSTEMFRGTLDRMVCRSGGIVAFPCGKIPSHGHAAALAFTDEGMVCIGTEEVHTITGGVGDEIVSKRRGIEFKYSIAKRTLYTKFQIITMTPAMGAKALAVLTKQ